MEITTFTLFLKIIAFLVAICLLVTVHEFAHFWVARRLGVKTLKFSIGFGKSIFRWYGKDGTEYAIGVLPFGGYVKLLDEAEGKVPADEVHLAFNRKPIWVRAAVVLAGPLMNWILAIILFALVFMLGIQRIVPVVGEVKPGSIAAAAGLKSGQRVTQIDNHPVNSWSRVMMAMIYRMGEHTAMTITTEDAQGQSQTTHHLNLSHWQVNNLTPDPIASLGITPYEPNVAPLVNQVLPASPAAKAGMEAGDRILTIADQPIKTWQQAVAYVQARPNQSTSIMVERNGVDKKLTLKIGAKKATTPPHQLEGFLGIESFPAVWPAGMLTPERYSLFTAWAPAIQQTWRYSVFNFVVLGKMVMGKISMRGLGGPITVFSSAGQAFIEGLVVYLSFLALLSSMLACINILPIPGLDGGHLLFLMIEAIQRKPVELATQAFAWRIGFLVLIFLMIQATINDVLRLLQ